MIHNADSSSGAIPRTSKKPNPTRLTSHGAMQFVLLRKYKSDKVPGKLPVGMISYSIQPTAYGVHVCAVRLRESGGVVRSKLDMIITR